jgi:hypothetical protein
MDSTDYRQLYQLERELTTILKEEFSFYQSLYIMLDKQREMMKYEKDENLLDLFSEIEQGKQRIISSEERIAGLHQRYPTLFASVLQLPDVKKLINSIATLVKKNLTLVTEGETFMKGRYERLRAELGQLQNSRKILQYINDSEQASFFVDGKN